MEGNNNRFDWNSRQVRITGYIMLGIFLLLTIQSFAKPLEYTETKKINTINQHLSYDYMVDVSSSVLYPGGGMIEAGGTIFTSITRGFLVNINYIISSENPIFLDGAAWVNVKLISEDQWEREFPVGTRVPVNMEGTENTLINDNYYIPLNEMQNFIDRVEEEIGAYGGNYLIHIKPEFEGSVTLNGAEISLPEAQDLIFSLGSREIVLASDRVFFEGFPIEDISVINTHYNIFGIKLPLMPMRIVFLLICLALAVFLFINTVKQIKKSGEDKTEADIIEKKYGKKFVDLKNPIVLTDQYELILDNFKSMLRIAEDKDLPIFREKSEKNCISYRVLDGKSLYTYRPKNKESTIKKEGFTRIPEIDVSHIFETE